MLRVDSFPTHEHEGLKLRPGRVMPFGATIVEGGVNFSVYSSHATSCSLVLFRRGEADPYAVIPFTDEFRIGHVFAMVVYDLDYEDTEYGYVMDGPYDRSQGHWFDPSKVLVDPYAKVISGRDVWGAMPDDGALRPMRSRILQNDFDWQGDVPLETPMEDLVIYETHVRGLTAHPSSGVRYPGTFAAVREKIPYLKELGVNAVELLPVFEFDEFENWRPSADGEGRLLNYWGYSTVGFFAPKAGLAATGHLGMQADELKALVRDLHRNGIEVILDVVFNHTAEGNENGPYISFRGIDNKTYYLLTPDGWYYNFSGCGNTLNCNNPVVRNMILDCLRYWASEYHVDGFRFDLASILGRDQDGAPLASPPLLESLAFDPVLGKCKLIAEAWDAGGMYQVGTFPSWGRWTEWNGRYRDDVRRFLKGDGGVTWLAAQAMQGSPHVYDPAHRGHCASVNFITAHDGFTLMDLFSYNDKQNLANGEDNRDGANDNQSWDCVLPGASAEQTEALRRKMVKNALTVLLLSHGVPMLLAGDEFGNTQGGNNNTYCQDNETGWLDWGDLDRNRDLFEYAKKLIALRHAHRCLRSSATTTPTAHGYPPVSVHGVVPWQAEYWGNTLAVLFSGDDAFVHVVMNMHWEDVDFTLPGLPPGFTWRLELASDDDTAYPGDGAVRMPSRSTAVFTATPATIFTPEGN
ncbi:glycogen debranching enzyme GlgX [Xylanimonas cellulosilytica DSM 15894]|uniref:Glycogen debranching enzyme GlgX n=1 Tax=Xylanimonas cellulosilytica (strain DSM 15894 / JCM 12276 / CECT 5975 / KCTC 9989 / LMG 20990 / NBRC 107835 / XIL07) TaxID=446471 RepID=D1BYK0_XYLCX|nr:alpha-amylase family glycosyl hydrolase [Xylanimonas cellulosilytica]ACZ31872.1 glycogen debranching enzyme GlgX [Xylanimonas cellulosilytica DSM 15894]